MPSYEVGKVIKNLREEAGLTQDELAEGIVTRENLSRNESGKNAPSPYTATFLLEKLGVNPHFTGIYYLSEKWRKTHELVERLDTYLAYGKVEEAENLLPVLEKDKGFSKDKVNQRYLLLTKAVIKLSEGENEEALRLCLEALHQAFPNFEENLISKYLLTTVDLRLVNLLGVLYKKIGEKEKALPHFQQLMANMDNRYMDRLEKGRHYPLVVVNLASTLTEQGEYTEAMALCDKAIAICKDTGFVFCVPSLSLAKASCLFELGQVEESKRLFYQAYNTCCLLGQDIEAEFACKFILEHFEVDLSKQNPLLRGAISRGG